MKNENKRHKINILYLVPTSHVNLSNAMSIFDVGDYHITFIRGKIITSPFISTFRIGILSATTTLFLPSMCLDSVSVAAAILDDLVFWYQEVCTQQTMLLSWTFFIKKVSRTLNDLLTVFLFVFLFVLVSSERLWARNTSRSSAVTFSITLGLKIIFLICCRI